MKIILNPLEDEKNKELKNFYTDALSNSLEIFIVSAYLTDWDIKYRLNKNCKEFCFIVGTNFGITRKDACKNVLSWLPKNLKADFCAADFTIGFHPKIVIWKNKKGCNAIIGSSNLTQAGFSSNYEVNVYSKINSTEYIRLKEWIYSIKSLSTPISEDWLNNYTEIKRKPSGSLKTRVIELKLPKGITIEESIKSRRKQQKKFSDIENKLIILINKCANKTINNQTFYQKLVEIWGTHESRFQGQGFQIKGKNGNWQEICIALSHILNGRKQLNDGALDILIKNEIDLLAKNNNPNRSAWFTEMLCHFYPEKYPLVNKPVKTWLGFSKFRAPKNSSEGSKYIDLSVKFRQAIKGNTFNSAKNLAELDGAIWQWYYNNYLRYL